jgi:replicative DNA helicase
MLEEADFINRIKSDLEPADFRDERICRIVRLMFDLIDQGKAVEPHKLMNYLEGEDILQVICESSFLPEIPPDDKERVVDDCVQRLKHERLKFRRHQLHEEIKSAQHNGDEEKLHKLMREFHTLIKKR